MAAWPIHLPAHTVYKHFSSQYAVFVWCDIVWAQVCLGQRGFLRITAVVLRTALRPYIFHVISVKGTWCFPVPNQEGPGAGTGGHIGKLSFLNDSHCCRQTKARFWILACGRVLRSSVWHIHHLPKQGAKRFKKVCQNMVFSEYASKLATNTSAATTLNSPSPPPPPWQFCTGAVEKEHKIIDIVFLTASREATLIRLLN